MAEGTRPPKLAIALSLLAGIAIGAAVTSALHAQVKPAVYSVDEAFADVDLSGVSDYTHNYVSLTQATRITTCPLRRLA
jgi:predicted nucleotidyltransferase